MLERFRSRINWGILINLGLLLLFIQILVYAKVKFGIYFFSETIIGDESKYLEDLMYYKENGFYLSVVKGISITYLFFCVLIDELIKNPILSLRITSLVSSVVFLVITILIERKYFRLSFLYRNVAYISIFYVIILQSYLFIGINDLLLDVFGSFIFMIIFIEMNNNISKKSKKNFVLIGVFLALMISTRRMSLVYFPCFFFIFMLIRRNGLLNLFNKSLYLFVGFVVILFFLHYPSIKENKKLSFDDKILTGDVNWSQKDYHNMMMINKGKGIRGKHINIEETKEYLKVNGVESLPNTFFEMIFFDIKLTFIEFYYGVKASFVGFVRSLGLLFFGVLFFFKTILVDIIKFKTSKYSNVVVIFSLSFTLLISFIVISYIQFRWFMLFLPLLIISILRVIEDLKINRDIKSIFLLLHILTLLIMNIPYLVKIFEIDF